MIFARELVSLALNGQGRYLIEYLSRGLVAALNRVGHKEQCDKRTVRQINRSQRTQHPPRRQLQSSPSRSSCCDTIAPEDAVSAGTHRSGRRRKMARTTAAAPYHRPNRAALAHRVRRAWVVVSGRRGRAAAACRPLARPPVAVEPVLLVSPRDHLHQRRPPAVSRHRTASRAPRPSRAAAPAARSARRPSPATRGPPPGCARLRR